ncbi:MAG: MBOAT family O-acyltransferase [Hominenteromicrobium sp.]
MVFSSLPFLYFFLPAALLLGLAAPRRVRNAALLVLSLLFYFFGEPRFTALLLITAAAAWGCGLWAEKRGGRLPLLAVCALSLGQLVYFKYADFLIGTVNGVFGARLPLLHLALPIGISFYTFQAISYVADVSAGRVAAARNPIDFAAYLTFFPQLIAGPVVRYSDVQGAIRERRVTLSGFSAGAVRFCVGLGKKVLLANVLAEATADFAAAQTQTVLYTWLYALCNALMIYFDFSGYSDMAIGLGRMFGFDFPENFRYPFASRSVSEFWRRWHITLGTWFRDYVYIPLGGSRCTRPKQVRNLLVVWALTGLWHGASWTFVLWGLYFAVLLILERLFLAKWLARAPRAAAHLYVTLAVLVSFVLFSASSPAQALTQLLALFGLSGAPLWDAETLWALKQYGAVLLVSVLGAVPLVPAAVRKLRARPHGEAVCAVLQPVVMLVLLVASTAYLAAGSFNPFLYFRF